MNDTHQELRDLITDVVTGDGAQLENLSMPDAEWERTAKEQTGERQLFITVTLDDWLAMLEVARNNTDTPDPNVDEADNEEEK